MTTRAEHLAWCKERALEYINTGDVRNGLNSMLSDMSKHDETKDHAALQLMAMLMFGGQLSTTDEAREFINGFN